MTKNKYSTVHKTEHPLAEQAALNENAEHMI